MGAYCRASASKPEIQEDLNAQYQRFPRLRERSTQLAGTLSGGEQQMLAMGRALMAHPELLLLDEPSMGLSPVMVETIFQVIAEVKARSTTILLVEQNARLALQMADRALVLESGEVTLEGSGQDLLASPAVRAAYLGE
jgi:branched-chain amino acid transport system ATP-binding protein